MFRVNITISLQSGNRLAGINVTVTDPLGSRSTVSDSQGNYLVNGIIPGNYSVTYEAPQLGKLTLTGSLSSGEAGILDAVLSPLPIVLSVSSPADGAVVSTLPLPIGGTAQNADSVTVRITNNGSTIDYPAALANGAYSALVPLASGQTQISVIAANKYSQTASQSITVNIPPVAIVTTSLSNGYAGFVYSQPLAATGGIAPYTWSLASGTFPAGLTLDATGGVLGGTPATAGNSSFSIQVTDANNAATTRSFTMAVYAPLIINTTTLADGFVGTPYSQTLTAGGGRPPFSWSVISGSLPSGLILDAGAGAITGIPAATGTSSFTIQGKDVNNVTAIMALSITVAYPFTVRSLGDMGNVTVMEATGNYDAKTPDGSINDKPRQAIAKEYFKTHGDLDFLVMLSTFDYAMPESEVKGFFLEVKNDTQGIGQSILDNSAQFGSAGMLQGTIDLGNVTSLAENPYGPKLDETLAVLNHELVHRFGAYVRFKNPDGTLNMALLGKESAHWSYLLDTQGSLMYGNGWKDNGNGTFTSTAARSGYSPLDLYLMGLIPKDKVPPMLLIDNPAIDKMQLPQLGATVSGMAQSVTIDDIIAAEGARIPDSTTSQKKFSVGFVLLTRPGTSAGNAPAAIETLRTAWAGRFAELTQGIGGAANVPATLNEFIDSPADGAAITGPDVTVSGSVINSTGVETGVVVNGIPATVTGSRFIINHVPLQQGTNSIAITANDANGLSATTSRSVTATVGHYIRITSNIDSGVAPLNISLRLAGSFSSANLTVTPYGPVPVTLTAGTSPTEFTAQLTVEGTYTFTASAVGPDAQTFSDLVTVTVVSKTQLDNLLKAKWDGMKGAMALMDIQKAAGFFVAENKDRYSGIFTALGDSLPQVAQDMQNVRMIYLKDRIAKYRIKRTEVAGVAAYYIYFVKDDSGLWKIQQL